MEMEGDVTWGGGHIVQYTGFVHTHIHTYSGLANKLIAHRKINV